MKRICVFLLCITLVITSISAYAEKEHDNLIEVVKQDTSVDMSLIDESGIVYAEISSYINLDKGIQPTSFYLYMPVTDSTDYFTAGFDKNEYVSTIKNFSATKPLEYFSIEEAKSYMKDNGLGEPEEVKAFLTHGRVGLFAYNVSCDGITYIIPYYFTEDSTYNIVEDESCVLSIGAVYTVEEFVEISEKEHELYNAYMSKKNAEKDSPSTALNPEGETVTDSTKKEDIVEKDDKDVTEEKEDINKDKDDKEDIKEEIENKLDDTHENENNINTKEPVKTIEFIDVPATHWAYNEIQTLASSDVILGYGNGYFGTNDNVTREHLALLLDRQFDYKSELMETGLATREEVIVSIVKSLNVDLDRVDSEIIYEKFSDGSTVSEKNEKYIAYSIQTKLVVGYDGRLYLDSDVTRAETACLIYRAMSLIE